MKLHRDVSENPSSGGLTEVIDAQRSAEIEKDTQSDLRLMAILSALRNGCLPSNQQLDDWLDRLSSFLGSAEQDGLSDDTVAALSTAKTFTDTLRQVLREKNGDELLQETLSMAWFETRKGGHRPQVQAATAFENKERPGTNTDRSFEEDLARNVDAAAPEWAVRDGQLREAVRYIRILGTILFTNSDLRVAITELTALAPKHSGKGVAIQGENQEGTANSSVKEEPNAAQTADAGPIDGGDAGDRQDAEYPPVPGAFGHPASGWEDIRNTFVDAAASVALDPRVTEFLGRLRGALASMQEEKGYTQAMTWLLDTFAAYEYDAIAQTHPELVPEYRRPQMTPTRRILANIDNLSHWLSNEVYASKWNAAWAGLALFLGVDEGFDFKSHQGKLQGWFADDALTHELKTQWTQLTDALLLDNEQLVFKRVLWSEFGKLAITGINWRGFITLPRMEVVSPSVELVLENLHVSLANLFPSILDFQVHDQTRFSPFAELRGSCEAATRTRLRIQAEQIQADLRDMLVSVRVPRLGFSDQGRANIALTRRGLWFDIEVELDTHPRAEHVVQARRINIGIDELSLVMKGTRRDCLYATLLPLGIPFLKWRLVSTWKLKLAQQIQRLDSELCELRDRVHEEKRRRTVGNSEPRASTRLFKVLVQRLREAKSVAAKQAAKKARAVRARSRRRKDSGMVRSTTPSGEASISRGEEAGPDEPEPQRGFKLSFGLADAMLPHVSADRERSLLFRRERAERAARSTALDSTGSTSSMRLSTTAMGLGDSSLHRRPWRSPAFNRAT
ncbi:hypothetical protein CspeluHIS016_0105800 [Cutaneotrichosporon spelunceum]|uniref:HAM1-like N-terminal domain-containing protein n=1 Tax=Cutaneotrichosporon spelunceum TaxID=1672016 RepID=A0AAD3Y9S9_9TREE|nr:hypothetical protein CspeluHIS016_0105800 [Cutaneotrichosporon spelunceum]